MNRRSFLIKTSGLLLTAWVSPAFAQATRKEADKRVCMGTVLFRYRFKQTKPKEIAEIKDEFTLLKMPDFLKNRFGIHNIEFWSNHFESQDTAYLDELKAKIAAAGSKLINVQIDSEYNLANKDEEKRQASITHVKTWIDAVSHLGSECIRINPGNGSIENSIASLKEVAAYAKSKNLVFLTENHFGLEMNPDVHLRIIKEVGDIYTLPDFGNYPAETRFENLAKILPHAYLISAKVVDFNENLDHISFDFDECVRLSERLGFKGLYSVEQWSPKFQDLDYEKVGDWLIRHVEANI